jgi:hypothetical protein
MSGGFICKQQLLVFRAIPLGSRFPALEWFAALERNTRGQFLALAQLMDRAHRGGFRYSGRVTKMRGSRVGLLELRVTPPGGVSPHVRVFGVLRGDTVWLTFGYTKRDRKLDTAVVARAERLVQRWEAAHGRSKRADQAKKAKPRPH